MKALLIMSLCMCLFHKIKNKICYGDERKFSIQFDDIQQMGLGQLDIHIKKKKKRTWIPYLAPQRLTQSRLYIDLKCKS